jgi:low temperature requirement protein LtrA
MAAELSITVAGARLTLLTPRIFARKTAMVFALALLLLPLVRLRSELPALIYVAALLLLHVVVLILYFYRVQLRKLDPDRRSLVVRIAAIAFMTYLLFIVSGVDAEAPLRTLFLQVVAYD